MGHGRWGRWAAIGLGLLFLALFIFANRGERVSLSIGVTVLYRIPLVAMLFLAYILGMVTMFLFGLRHDIQVRRHLRDDPPDESPPPRWSSDPPPEAPA